MPVQLDVKRAALFRIGNLVRRGKLVRRRVGGQAVCQQRLVAGKKFILPNIEVVVGADAVVLERVEPAAKLPLDHNGMQPCRPELAVEVCKFRRAHGLAQHLPDDLLPGGREQVGVLPCGGRLADGLEEDRQQLLLVCQREDRRPVHGLRGKLCARDGGFGNIQKLCFGGCQGHVHMPNPFLVFFDDAGEEQRCRVSKRAQRIANHAVPFRHAEGAEVLGVLDPYAEEAADKRREDDPDPAIPLPRQLVLESVRPSGKRRTTSISISRYRSGWCCAAARAAKDDLMLISNKILPFETLCASRPRGVQDARPSH